MKKIRTGYVEGEIEFKWIFYASVDEDYIPPNTGLFLASNKFWMTAIAVVAVLTGGMLLLIFVKKRERRQENMQGLRDEA